MSGLFIYEVSIVFGYFDDDGPVKLFRIFKARSFLGAIEEVEGSLPDGGQIIDIISVVRTGADLD